MVAICTRNNGGSLQSTVLCYMEPACRQTGLSKYVNLVKISINFDKLLLTSFISAEKLVIPAKAGIYKFL